MSEEKLYYKISSNIGLYTNDMTENAEKWAKERWNLKDVRVFILKDREFKIYAVARGKYIDYTSQNYEQLCTHIDFLGFQEMSWE